MGSEVVGAASAALGANRFHKLLAALADQSQPPAVRCKLILVVSFMIAHSSRWLVLAVKHQIHVHFERVHKERTKYGGLCLSHLLESIRTTIPQLSSAAVAALTQAHGRPRPKRQPAPYEGPLTALITLLARPRLRDAVLIRGVVEDIASCLGLCKTTDRVDSEAVHAVLQCCEVAVANGGVAEKGAQHAIHAVLLPAISAFVFSTPPGDTQATPHCSMLTVITLDDV